jgi:hypothetical protein
MTKRGPFIVEDNAIPHCPHSPTGHYDYIHKIGLKESFQAKTILSIRSTFRIHGTPIRRQHHLLKVQEKKRCSKVSSVTQLRSAQSKECTEKCFLQRRFIV